MSAPDRLDLCFHSAVAAIDGVTNSAIVRFTRAGMSATGRIATVADRPGAVLAGACPIAVVHLRLLNQLISAQQQRLRDLQPERLGCLQVD